jgi:hypothetical protein
MKSGTEVFTLVSTSFALTLARAQVKVLRPAGEVAKK